MDEAEQAFRQRAKAVMRGRFRSQRSSLPTAAVATRSRALGERLLEEAAVQAASRVALFWPIERFHEVDLRPVDAQLRQRGVAIAYPLIDEATRVMTFAFAEPHDLVLSDLGFMAPPAGSPPAEGLDVVIVPGLAFDPAGYRIGYGAGFYDQALPVVRPPALAIGVAFDFQLAADIPFSDRDVSVDVIVTDSRRLAVTPEEAP